MQANAAPTPARGELATAAFVRLFAASLFAHLSIFLLVHLPGLLRFYGASESGIGTSASVFSAAAILSRPLVGRLLDARGRRAMLLFGAASHTFATALYLGVDRFGPWLYVVRALHGVSAGFLFSTLFTIAADLVPEERRTQGMALFGISGILPMSVSAFLGEHLLRAGGFELLFEIALAFSAIALALAPTIPESRPAKKEDRGGSFVEALAEPSLRVLWVVGTLFATALASYFVFVKSFAIDAHLGSVTAFFTAYSATAIVVRSFLGGLPARFGLERTFPLAVASLGLGLVVLASARGPSALALAGVLSGAGHAYAFPIMLTFFVDRSSPSVRGMVVSLYTALFDLGGFLAGPILGALADAEGHRVAFRVASVLALSGASLFVLFDRKVIARVA